MPETVAFLVAHVTAKKSVASMAWFATARQSSSGPQEASWTSALIACTGWRAFNTCTSLSMRSAACCAAIMIFLLFGKTMKDLALHALMGSTKASVGGFIAVSYTHLTLPTILR